MPAACCCSPARLGARERLVPVVWVAAACVSIAINGSRGLPQYFIQANPALALAAGWGGGARLDLAARRNRPAARLIAVPVALVVLVAVWRVNQFDKLAEQTIFDARYALGAMSRDAYLARYDDDRKYSALAGDTLGKYLAAHSQPTDRVFVFGFTCAAYVEAERASASRFFWSRPVIVGFNDGPAGYGVEGLLSDLNVNRPAVVALQLRDWAPDVDDSAAFFMKTPSLVGLAARPLRAGQRARRVRRLAATERHTVIAPAPLDARRFAGWLLLIALAALALRLSFPTADPPWTTTVGIVWHDEGAWVHNARNKALFGRWSEDAWNPMFIAPVFTGLEYRVVRALRRRRLAGAPGLGADRRSPRSCCWRSGVRRIAGREAGLIAGALLATNYVYVMWNRAALMEASMVAFMVAAWYCYVRAQTQPLWGALAAACALLAYFTKAAAIFFVAALGVEAVAHPGSTRRLPIPPPAAGRRSPRSPASPRLRHRGARDRSCSRTGPTTASTTGRCR